ncbi:fibronectin type III domain-containing protein [Marinobacterium rhizophilum]|uniref:fibronectin type III domain-containing protein n=1 Tax=Marinobacterium rhizophilum TaxID=420402 RepID=UPI00035D8190|nr:fibronectin type III domain-containing protein [Marinobacterium rhizophilum]
MMILSRALVLAALVLIMAGTQAVYAWTALPIAQDPLLRMPGTQPDQGVNLENPNRCLNCHAGFNPAGEPGFQWQGSMMAQAARDPIFWASMTVAGQDSIWALGNPNAVDLCERCHLPEGWLAGRSDPPNASLMQQSDFDGVHCDVCHRMWDPFFEEAHSGLRESSDWATYWDEAGNTGPGSGTLSQTEADRTYNEDWQLSQTITLFDGMNFFNWNGDKKPVNPDYTENASGQYFISPNAQKRASFADADARHQMLYSRYHKSKFFCGTCHDVSNPALANLNLPADGALPTELKSASSYYHVERTFSEFMLSDYGQPGGAQTNAEFQAQGAPGITHASKCQDCHMRDIRGTAANKRGAILRPDGSIEHPNSGVPLHDMTGGNSWITYILASLDPNGPVFDQTNADLLGQGPAILTLDLDAGQSPKVNGAALKAGSDRAKQQLLLAATIKQLSYNPDTGALSFRIQNNTGHKLLTGYPEGRRMFANIRAYDAGGELMQEINPYDAAVGTLKGLPGVPLSGTEQYDDDLVYEVHSSSSLTGEEHTFHFALADGRSKDNRIPPRGFNSAAATARLAQAIPEDRFTPDEYAGGYDDINRTLLPGAALVEVSLYYQGTSREYVAFLRDEINGTATTLTSPTPSGEPSAYVLQTDPFFSGLKAWGNTIWSLWTHNHGLDGSGLQVAGIVPFAMAEASVTVGEPPPPPSGVCETPTAPANLVATGAKRKVDLTWDAVSPAPSDGYGVYYYLAGKTQFADISLMPQYTDTGLKPNSEVCYVVTAWNDCDGDGVIDLSDGEESAASNSACAVPTRN